jgi:predicted Abi (CAAX) family protease
VVLTSVYHDLFSDAELLVARTVERNRRAAAPVFLVLGALMGGRFAESDWGVAGALWTAAALKAMVVVVWLAGPAAGDNEGEEE